MAKLLHAMGDVHPHALKAELARQLSRVTFERWSRHHPRRESRHEPFSANRLTGKTIFANSGFEAVEAALKTAILATGKPHVIAFHGAYHGVGYGALNATHRGHFRSPFLPQLAEFGRFAPFPRRAESLEKLRATLVGLFRRERIGAVLVEPVQVRGGINIPPPGFVPLLRTLCDEHRALLVLDEIYTGLGRTGRWFACEHTHTIPDLICLGKGLTGGFPLSVCVGRADIMDAAWPRSTGEAIHTSTFLGHPVGCAMALAQIQEIGRHRLVVRSSRLGAMLLRALAGLSAPEGLILSSRGLGLLAGLSLEWADGSPAQEQALEVIQRMLDRGFILLPEGEHSNVISMTPPLTITLAQLRRTVETLRTVLNNLPRQ